MIAVASVVLGVVVGGVAWWIGDAWRIGMEIEDARPK